MCRGSLLLLANVATVVADSITASIIAMWFSRYRKLHAGFVCAKLAGRNAIKLFSPHRPQNTTIEALRYD
jgi:Zn-dependent protease with chaperone function